MNVQLRILFQTGLQVFYFLYRKNFAIDANMLEFFRGYPFVQAGIIFGAHLHQFDAAAGQLLFGLQKITRIGPEFSLIGAHGQGAGAAAESRQISTILEMFGHVFALMIIGRGHNAQIDVEGFHVESQARQSFLYLIHSDDFFCASKVVFFLKNLYKFSFNSFVESNALSIFAARIYKLFI